MVFGTKTRWIDQGGHPHEDAIACAFAAKVNGYQTTVTRLALDTVTILGMCHMQPYSDGQEVQIDFVGGVSVRFKARVEAVQPDSNLLSIRRIGELERKILEGVMRAVQMRAPRQVRNDLADSIIQINPDGSVIRTSAAH